MHPLCFVLMPFGKKPDASGRVIDFDGVYHELIAPAISEAGLEPVRADEEMAGGIIHKPMFERLVLCEFAVADLTTANANVFYELGVRHAVRPWSTVLLFAGDGGRLPFDVANLRANPYRLGPDGRPADAERTRAGLVAMLKAAREAGTDSPLYQLLDGYPDIDHTRTDVFREQVAYSAARKKELATVRTQYKQAVDKLSRARDLDEAGRKKRREEERQKAVDELRRMEADLKDLCGVESGVVVDLLTSYRAVDGWEEMIALAEKMPAPLAATILVREQLGFALNRAGRRGEAERVLRELIEQRGASSETCGLLGRVYKDLWEEAVRAGEEREARSLLDKAIATYRQGFEADWRDAYPGVNAVTLMEIRNPPDPEREKLLPVVAYAVERRMAGGKPDYWDHATLLELAVLARDRQQAEKHLGDGLIQVREAWEPETTARNLRLIREARERRQEGPDWAVEIEKALLAKTGR